MFTTPNKRFPVELHSFLPFVHWLPDEQFRAVLRALGHHELATVDDLNPLDEQTFLSMFPPERRRACSPAGFPSIPTNLICVSTARDG